MVQQCATCKSYVPVINMAAHICPGTMVTNHKTFQPQELFTSRKSISPLPVKPPKKSSPQISDTEEIVWVDFIQAVESRRPLWDHKSLKPVERSEAVRNKLWAEISHDLKYKYDVETLKIKWKYMRDEFKRRRVGMKSGSGAQKEWLYMKYLSFLDDIIFYEPTTTNLDSDSSSNHTDIGSGRKKRKLDNNDHLETLMTELINNKPKTPPPEPTPSAKFFGYLSSIMDEMPLDKQIQLHGEFFARVVQELKNK